MDVEIIPRQGRVPTWGQLRRLLPATLIACRPDVVSRDGRRGGAVALEQRFELGATVFLRLDGEEAARFRVRAIDAHDVMDFIGVLPDETLADWLDTGFSLAVAVRDDGAWRGLARALAEHTMGAVVVTSRAIPGFAPGVYRPEQLARVGPSAPPPPVRPDRWESLRGRTYHPRVGVEAPSMSDF